MLAFLVGRVRAEVASAATCLGRACGPDVPQPTCCTGYQCGPDNRCCRPTGAKCARDGQCCSDACLSNGTCKCTAASCPQPANPCKVAVCRDGRCATRNRVDSAPCGNGQVCLGGVCGCPSGQRNCGGGCEQCACCTDDDCGGPACRTDGTCDSDLAPDEEAFIFQTVTTFMGDYDIPGLSLALTIDGRLVYARGFGVVDPATDEPVTTPHLFRIASVSKPITSAAIFRLIDQGKLALTDTVFGPDAILETRYGTPPYGPRIDQITVQHLLEHTSGWANPPDDTWDHLDLSQAELIGWVLDNRPLATAPGAVYDYQNVGYLVLGRVIEAVTGEPYERWVRQNVLAPCGISDMWIAGDTLAERHTNEVVYHQQGNASPYGFRISRQDVQGGWIASATDLMRFVVAVNGFATKPDVLSTAAVATMSRPSTAAGAGGYAKGWNTNAWGNWWHAGSQPGSASHLDRNQDGRGWAMLVNSRDDANQGAMMQDLNDLISPSSATPSIGLR